MEQASNGSCPETIPRMELLKEIKSMQLKFTVPARHFNTLHEVACDLESRAPTGCGANIYDMFGDPRNSAHSKRHTQLDVKMFDGMYGNAIQFTLSLTIAIHQEVSENWLRTFNILSHTTWRLSKFRDSWAYQKYKSSIVHVAVLQEHGTFTGSLFYLRNARPSRAVLGWNPNPERERVATSITSRRMSRHK